MLTVKYLLEFVGFALLAGAAAMIALDLFRVYARTTATNTNDSPDAPAPIKWRRPARTAGIALAPLLLGIAIEIVPAGMAGVRVSQISGTVPGTLYPGYTLSSR